MTRFGRQLSSSNIPVQNSHESNNLYILRIVALGATALLIFSFLFPQHSFFSTLEQHSKPDVYTQTPFCNPEGNCGEDPTVASPRTVYSAKSQTQYDLWWKFHGALNRSAADYATRRPQNSAKRPLILLGDSITESWLGTNMGKPEVRTKGVPDVYQEYFVQGKHSKDGASKWDPLPLAIGGDQTQHLLYRMENGQLLPEYANDTQAVFVILIGTNNLGSGELPEPSAKGVGAVAEYVLRHTQGKLIWLHLLPRGDVFRLPQLCPPRCDSEGKPFKSFMPAIQKVNEAIPQQAEQLKKKFGEQRLNVVDCGKEFLNKVDQSGEEVVKDLMPDHLHPNAEGHKLLAKCILACVEQGLCS